MAESLDPVVGLTMTSRASRSDTSGSDVSSQTTGAPNQLELLLDLEELDEREYDLPPVTQPPTLESILNEADGSCSDADDDIGAAHSGGFQQDGAENHSLSSLDSARPSGGGGHGGSILRHVVLRGVSSQLQSAADRFGAGKPTVMAVSLVIAVGTSHGLVFVFDPEQALKWCLGSSADGEEYGAVSALDISLQCTRLLVGHARGHITLWNLSTGALLQTVVDAHPPQCPVLHLRFLEDHHIAVCSDGGGSVFELTFTRKRGSRTCNSRCIFSGSRGEVFALEPLHVPPGFKKRTNETADGCVVALATVTKVIVVSLRPFLKVHFSHALHGDPHTLPLLCWQFVIIQMSPGVRVVDPVLTFCRQSVLSFFQANFQPGHRVKFASLKSIELPYVAQNIKWLNARTLAVFDTSEQLHVIDIRSHEEQEVADLSGVELVYGTSHFKGLATGGNVSKAMAAAGERACFHSMVGFGPQLLFLGVSSVHVVTLRTWSERIDHLTKQNRYAEALELALAFYEDRAKAVVGLAGKKPQRQQQVAETMAALVQKYVDLSMTQLCPDRGRIEDLIEHYRRVVPQCVRHCLAVGRKDLLYGKVWETFSADVIARGVFLESLEAHILDERLADLPPTIAKEFVTHFLERKQLRALEACVVRLDIACLDIHQLMTACREHGLYDAVIYVYNRGLGDYVTPLEELLEELGRAVGGKQLSDEHVRLGNKLLVYISFSLAGKAYPTGEIDPERAPAVKSEVLQCITCLRPRKPPSVFDATIYPYLKILLRFDTREFLNVLSLAFEDLSDVDQRQRVVDILLLIMVNCSDFSPSQVGLLFTFLARQLARPDNTVVVDRTLFGQVLEYLTVAGEEARLEERQQATMELLQAGGLEQVDEEQLLRTAEGAKFFRVCEFLYEKRRRFDKVLLCHLEDPARRAHCFSFVRNVLAGPDCTHEEKAEFREVVLRHFRDLVSVDAKEASETFLEFLPDRIREACEALEEDDPRRLYQFLQSLFSLRETGNGALASAREQASQDPELQERYVELMCRFDPSQVHGYLCMADGFRLEETLEICRRHGITDSVAHLLEKTGDVHGAFEILVENLRSKVRDVERSLLEGVPQASQWNGLQAVLLKLIQLCQSHGSKMDGQERESLWFALVEIMLAVQHEIRGRASPDHVDAFKELTNHLLSSMVGYVALPSILQRIMADPAYDAGKLGEIRELFMGMLDTYNYEKMLLLVTNSLLSTDLHNQMAQLKAVRSRAFPSRYLACATCKKELAATYDADVVLFRCGHSAHRCCLEKAQGTADSSSRTSVRSEESDDGGQRWSCTVCVQQNAKKAGHPSSLVRHPSSAKDASRRVTLDSHQMEALSTLRRYHRSPSRLAAFDDLRKSSSRRNPIRSLFSQEELELQLTPRFEEEDAGSL